LSVRKTLKNLTIYKKNNHFFTYWIWNKRQINLVCCDETKSLFEVEKDLGERIELVGEPEIDESDRDEAGFELADEKLPEKLLRRPERAAFAWKDGDEEKEQVERDWNVIDERAERKRDEV